MPSKTGLEKSTYKTRFHRVPHPVGWPRAKQNETRFVCSDERSTEGRTAHKEARATLEFRSGCKEPRANDKGGASQKKSHAGSRGCLGRSSAPISHPAQVSHRLVHPFTRSSTSETQTSSNCHTKPPSSKFKICLKPMHQSLVSHL